MSKILRASKAYMTINGKRIDLGEAQVTMTPDEEAEGFRKLWKEQVENSKAQWKTPIIGTITGRFSCLNPNIINLPKGFTVDYGKLEERILAASPLLEAPYGQVQAHSDGHGAYDIIRNDDVVYTSFGMAHKAKVLKNLTNGEVLVKFNDTNLIPDEMVVPARMLTYAWGGQYVNAELHCPKCDLPWKQTALARTFVYDCPACGAKKEDHAR